ncbi:aspartate carbamoyltransferase catalytic subunit [Actinomycetes bacterium NPDC127524]
MKDLLTMNALTTHEMKEIISLAEGFSRGDEWRPKHQTMVSNLFFEPSTRTKCSFEAAERKLGLYVIPFEAGSSSVLKGESLYDTARTLEAIGIQALVIRHEKDHYFDELADRLKLSIINAGDGCGHHPTQSLLDLMTIKQEFHGFKDLKISIIGDAAHSRVARSNAEALKRLGSEVVFSGPKEWFNDDRASSYVEIEEAIETSDVVMLLRIQHERHQKPSSLLKENYLQQYGLTKKRESSMKKGAIIMHPAPVNRGAEIDSDLVECSRSRIFKQMANGVFIRMAVLRTLLERNEGRFNNEKTDQKWSMV